MAKKLFVGGLPYTITSPQLEEMFSKFGTVLSVNVITDKYSGQSKGFAFVEMEKETDADEAINKLHETEIEGRKIAVSVARPREEKPRFDARGGSGKDFGKPRRRDSRY